jgi:NADPH2:quinone reductase
VKASIASSLLASVWPALEDGRIVKPRIQTFPLAEAANAHRAIENRSNFGKLVLLTSWGTRQ